MLFTFLQVVMQDSQVQSTSLYQRPSKIHPGKGRGGEERERDVPCQVAVLPCPVQQNFTTTSQRIFEAAWLHWWSIDLMFKKIAENGLQTTTSSHCMHFQEVICDIPGASSILVKMVIILKEGRGKGKEII